MSKIAIIVLALALLLATAADAAPAKRKRVIVDDSGPDLPYPCFIVRWYGSRYTAAQLEEMGRANGIALSPKQRRQARDCMRGG